MIGIVDYGTGNLGSVKKKLDRVKASSIISSDTGQLINCDKLILPGVGMFTGAIKGIKEAGLWDFLNEEVLVRKKPVLGICLGMQIMAKRSEEGEGEGFGWFDAEIVRFRISNSLKYKVPHTGWNNTVPARESLLLKNIESSHEFYFIHSFHMICNNRPDILSETTYENPFVSAVNKGNIFGVQYHPEKSHDAGELLLRNFISIQCSGQE